MLLERLMGGPPAVKTAAGTLSLEELSQRLRMSGGGGSNLSGISVTPESALRQTTVYQCVRIVGEAIASLPLGLYRKEGKRKIEVTDHPALEVLAEPNDWMTQHELMQFLLAHTELAGNAFAFKIRNGEGRVRRILPVRPDECTVEQMQDWSLLYSIGTDRGISGTYGPDRVMHLRNFGTDGYLGLSTIRLHREQIGLSLQMQRHAAALFANGAQLGRFFVTPHQLDDPAFERLKAEIKAQAEGAHNSGKSMLLDNGLDVKSVAMNNEDAQFIELMQLTTAQIAGLFGVPLFMVNQTEKSTSWGSGMEQIGRAFVNYALKPRLSRLTQTMRRELLLPAERRDHFFAFDTDEFVMGDFMQRMQGYEKGINSGVLSPNEAREWENLNPRDGGDDYRIPLNTGTDGDRDEDPSNQPTV